jgi:hypothetical protein
MSTFLKIVNEVENMKNIIDPQVCVTLPAIIYQKHHPHCFDEIRGKSVLATDNNFKSVSTVHIMCNLVLLYKLKIKLMSTGTGAVAGH